MSLPAENCTALDLASHGIPVFPCSANKTPLTANGLNDATIDADQIRQWWAQWPHALPGVPTGKASGLIALDIDRKNGKDGFATLEGLGLEIPATRRHQTQSGGAHYLYRMPPGADLRNTAGKIGAGVDTRAEGGYIVWWPGQGLKVENAAHITDAPQWLLEGTQSRAEPSERPAHTQGSAVAEGGRNDHLFRLASSMRGKGLSKAAAEAALLAENLERCIPPLPDAEVKKIAQSATRYQPGTDWAPVPGGVIKRPGFGFVHVRELLKKPEPIDYLVEGLIEAGTLCHLFGASGAGKSFLALDWCASIATGRDWNGKATKQGPVFYIAGEGHAGFGRRMRAWELHNGVSLKDAPFFFSTGPAALMDAGNAAVVAEKVRQLAAEYGQPAMIGVDTMARNLGDGDENSNRDIGVFINNIDVLIRSPFESAVLIVHHSGHQETQRSRGASALRAAMDHEFRLDAVETASCVLHVTKAKEGEKPPPLNFELKQIPLPEWANKDGELMTSAVLVPTDQAPDRPKKTRLTEANRIALDALVRAIEYDGKTPDESIKQEFGLLAPSRVVHEEVWRQRCYDQGISDGEQSAKQKAFKRARTALLGLGMVATWQEHYWRTFAPNPDRTQTGHCPDLSAPRPDRTGHMSRDMSGCPGADQDADDDIEEKEKH